MRSVGGPDWERELVQTFQQGDESVYDEIYVRYRGRVYSVCYRMLGRAPEAEEATQETFLRAYQALGRFNGSYYLGAWLSRIAANVCVDALRARARATLVALPDDLENLWSTPSTEDVVVGDHPRLDAAIDAIQPLHASALRLRAVQGLSHQEMAHHLAMTPSQVKALLHRARTSLRRAWDRVEGMALVPLLYARHLYGERSGQEAGTGLAGLAPSIGPALAEKVAASAVVVVTALAGVSGTAPTPSAPREQRVEGRAADRRAPAVEAPRTAAMATVAAGSHRPEGRAPGLLSAVDIEIPVEIPERRQGPEPKPDDDRERPGSGPPAHGAGAQETVQEVRQIAQEVKEDLTDS